LAEMLGLKPGDEKRLHPEALKWFKDQRAMIQREVPLEELSDDDLNTFLSDDEKREFIRCKDEIARGLVRCMDTGDGASASPVTDATIGLTVLRFKVESLSPIHKIGLLLKNVYEHKVAKAKEFERSPVKNTTTQNLRQIVETRLSIMLQKNPLRSDLQAHYQQIVEDYNREKDRANIEKTFEALLKFIEELDEEEGRAIREGLDEESLAIFDLLKKPQLSPAETKRVKEIAAGLLETLKQEKLRIDHWRDKEATRDAVRVTIYDFLYGDQTGLPEESYTTEDIHDKSEDVFHHIYRVYPTLPSPYYA